MKIRKSLYLFLDQQSEGEKEKIISRIICSESLV